MHFQTHPTQNIASFLTTCVGLGIGNRLFCGGPVESGERLSTEEFWQSNWQLESRQGQDFIFADFAKKFLTPGGKYIEIGCAPGTGMAFFSEEMNYDVAGVDFCALDKVEIYFKSRKIESYELINSDFLVWQSQKKYDLVASYGFIEHFENVDFVVSKHIDLLTDQGTLVLAVPNLRFVNWLIYRVVSPNVLKIHNLAVMNPETISNAVNKFGSFQTVYSGYWGSSFFQFSPDNPELDRFPLLKKIFMGIRKVMKTLKIDNIGNRYFSPYIIVLMQRK